MLLWMFIVILGCILFIRMQSWVRVSALTVSLPGPPVLPIVGNVFHSRKNIEFLDFLSTAYVKYGPIVKSWITIVPVIFVFEPKHVQVILGSSKLSEKSLFYKLLEPFAGTGLITHNGKIWKYHRKVIQPLFNTHMFEACIPSFNECSNLLIKTLKDVEEVRITAVVESFVMNMLYDIILGVPVEDSVTKAKSPFFKRRNTAFERILKPWLFLDFISKMFKVKKENECQETWEEFTSKILAQRKERTEAHNVSKWNLLELLYELSQSDNNFPMEDVINEACAFMLTGQDTTKVTLSFTLYYLAKHQDIQDKVVDEIEHVMQSSDLLNVDTLGKMKYLDQCIKESMRLCPAAPLISRRLLKDVQIDEYVLPAGCNVLISPYATHRIPKYFPNPEKFDPERFSEENFNQLHSLAYIPFSAGPRNCIASRFAMLGMKTVLSILLRNFKFYLRSEEQLLNLTYRLSLKAKGDIWLKLKPRNPMNT